MHPSPQPASAPPPGTSPDGRARADHLLSGAGTLAVISLGMLTVSAIGLIPEASFPPVAALLCAGLAGASLLAARRWHQQGSGLLVRSLEQHSTVFGQLSQPVAVVIDGEVQFANTAWALWRDQRLGPRIDALLAMAPGERRLPACDHHPALQIDLRQVPVRWAGQPAVLLQVQDQTDSRQLQAQIAGRDRLAQVGLLAAGVAHEINNPLMAVTTYLDLIAEEVEDDPMLVEMVAELGQALGHIRLVANDLRLLGRADSTRVEALDPFEPIRAAARMTRAQRGGDVEINVDLGELPPVRGAHGRLVQVFLNLFLNAAHAADEAGRRAPEVRVWAERTQDTVRIHVQDNGTGVPEALREAIFDAQFTTRGDDHGTGLGLWLSRKVVEEVEGTLELGTGDESPQRGAEFIVTLLRADAGALDHDSRDRLSAHPRGAAPSSRARPCTPAVAPGEGPEDGTRWDPERRDLEPVETAAR